MYDYESIDALREEMNHYSALKKISNGELIPDKRIFDPDAINHVYFLNRGHSDMLGHSALLLTDTNGNGFYFTLFQVNWQSIVGLSYLGQSEMETFYSQGNLGFQYGSDGGYYTYDPNAYDRWVDLIGIPERKANRRTTYFRCLQSFKELVDVGGSVRYDIVFDNCDDYAVFALTGKKDINLIKLITFGAAGYISLPHDTFSYFVEQAGEEYVTVLR